MVPDQVPGGGALVVGVFGLTEREDIRCSTCCWNASALLPSQYLYTVESVKLRKHALADHRGPAAPNAPTPLGALLGVSPRRLFALCTFEAAAKGPRVP